MYLLKENYIPVLIHNSDVFSTEASPNPNMRIMTPKLLEDFSSAVRMFVENVVKNGVIGNIKEIEKLLDSYNLNGEKIIYHYTKKYNQK